MGHTVRVVVTASNAGGSTPALSASAGPVSAQPPYCELQLLANLAGHRQQVTFDGTSSTCPDGPCTYEWSDDGSATRPSPPLWPLGSGQTLSFTFSEADTKYVRLVITDATGQTATVEHNVVVEASEPPPPPAAPTNTAPPTVSGSPEEGQTLTATTGTWTGSPTSYAYQWQDCNSSGASCSNISGATASTRVLTSSDVGHTLRIVVKAINTGGTGEEGSAATSLVTAKEKKEEGTPANCFESPETEGGGSAGNPSGTARIEACGYPGAHNIGPGGEGTAKCASYPEGGAPTIEAAGEIKEKRFTGVTIKHANVTLNDVCIVGASEKRVNLVEGANFTIENSVIRGTGTAKSEATEEALQNSYGAPNARAINDYIYNCGECVHQAWTLENSYVVTSTSPGSSPHYEDIYVSNGVSFAGNHDTLFNIQNQTAVFFQEGYKTSGAVASITNSFLAGGGYMLHPVGTVTFTGDRFARCLTTPLVSESGGTYCKGGSDSNIFGGEDAHGYFPNGGFFGLWGDPIAECIVSMTWSGNYWDNNLEPVAEP